MKTTCTLVAAGVMLVSLVSSQTHSSRPLTLALKCEQRDCPLLKGAPETAGMRSGFVRLRPGESVGWHSTQGNEESLVVLQGRGQALIEGQSPQEFTAREQVYIPPDSRHNVSNAGSEVLEYVYTVAPAGR